MTSYSRMKKATANKLASSRRKHGLNASIYKKKKGYGVSVTRK